jgi:RNA polymerase sigma-70 factor (ECF subfamily)
MSVPESPLVRHFRELAAARVNAVYEIEALADAARAAQVKGPRRGTGRVAEKAHDNVLDLARAGDEAAFVAMIEPLRRELHLHCYRMLGSFDEADDALQETLLAAWLGLDRFEGRASARTWLYRIATNTCLNQLRTASRRPQKARDAPVYAPAANGHAEVTWLQPYPDALLDELPTEAPGPEEAAERVDSVSLAFTVAIQALSPWARAVLVLRDVLAFTAAETAVILDSSADAVAMTLSRARATLRTIRPGSGSLPAAEAARLAQSFAQALARRDVDTLVRLLADDVRLSMPPVPLLWQGRDTTVAFLSAASASRFSGVRVVPVGANREAALVIYALDEASGEWRAVGLIALAARATLAGGEITAITHFRTAALRPFPVPPRLSFDSEYPRVLGTN